MEIGICLNTRTRSNFVPRTHRPTELEWISSAHNTIVVCHILVATFSGALLARGIPAASPLPPRQLPVLSSHLPHGMCCRLRPGFDLCCGRDLHSGVFTAEKRRDVFTRLCSLPARGTGHTYCLLRVTLLLHIESRRRRRFQPTLFEMHQKM